MAVDEMMDEDIIYTTNQSDKEAVAALQKQIQNVNQIFNAIDTSSSSPFIPVANVAIAPGAHKYVLISAMEPKANTDESVYFVTSKKGAHYHRNAAEPFVNMLQERGYRNIQVLGGGRIYMNEREKKIDVFGYSYGFGKADHEISTRIIRADDRYQGWNVTWSNDGY